MSEREREIESCICKERHNKDGCALKDHRCWMSKCVSRPLLLPPHTHTYSVEILTAHMKLTQKDGCALKDQRAVNTQMVCVCDFKMRSSSLFLFLHTHITMTITPAHTHTSAAAQFYFFGCVLCVLPYTCTPRGKKKKEATTPDVLWFTLRQPKKRIAHSG